MPPHHGAPANVRIFIHVISGGQGDNLGFGTDEGMEMGLVAGAQVDGEPVDESSVDCIMGGRHGGGGVCQHQGRAVRRGSGGGARTGAAQGGTDVVDVGCDLLNSEVMNSFLNVADIATSGIVSEPALRAIYDAYAATVARMLTQRWHEPVARMAAALYTWHIQNDRHMFLRRALLGWPKARKSPARPQREADFNEVFDADFHTTGFSRHLDPEYACDGGEETCNHVRRFLDRQDEDLLGAFWSSLVTSPLEYVRQGEVDEQREYHLVESSRLQMAQLFSKGLVVEMVWLINHANHHTWQVNYLFEAAMFGSILDGGALIGKLDRAEGEEEQDRKIE
ncbi:uncharacterized protein [Triticum aestivum]|uniref:uncharacterized protein n=1 Tax=Triticum aestivum TaxID=4565 RepID=UPI001D015920|nr:uncharacterized protein LOC123142363 [Triticum aestivum]